MAGYILYLFVIAIPFLLGSTGLPPFTFGEPIIALLFLHFAFRKYKKQVNIGFDVFNLLIGLFFVYVILQFLFGKFIFSNSFLKIGTLDRYETGCGIIRLMSYIMLFYIVISIFEERKKSINLIRSLILGCAIFAAIAIPKQLLYPGTRYIWDFDVLHFAAYSEMMLPLAFGYVLYGFYEISAQYKTARRDGKGNISSYIKNILERDITFFATSLIILSLPVFIVRTRTGIFMFFMELVLFGLLVSEIRFRKIVFLVITAVMFAVVLLVLWIGIEPIMFKFQPEQLGKGYEVRMNVFRSLFEIIRRYPVFGTGLNTLKYATPQFQVIPVPPRIKYGHNVFLQMLSEVGTAGFCIFLIAGFLFLRRSFNQIIETKDYFIKYIGAGCFVGIISIFINSLANFNLHIRANITGLTILIAILASFWYLQKEGLAKTTRGKVRKILFSICVFTAFVMVTGSFVLEDTAYYLSRHSKVSIKNLGFASKISPLNPEYRYYLSRAYIYRAIEQKEDIKKREYLKKAYRTGKEIFEISPWYYKGAFNLAQISFLLDDEKEATLYMEKYITMDPSNFWPYLYYAIFHFNKAKEVTIDMASEYIWKGIQLYNKAKLLYPDLDINEYKDYFTDFGLAKQYLTK